MTTKTIDKEALLKAVEVALDHTRDTEKTTVDMLLLAFAQGGSVVLEAIVDGVRSGRFDTKQELQLFTEEDLEDTNPDESNEGIIMLSADIKGTEREELAQHFRNKGYTVI